MRVGGWVCMYVTHCIIRFMVRCLFNSFSASLFCRESKPYNIKFVMSCATVSLCNVCATSIELNFHVQPHASERLDRRGGGVCVCVCVGGGGVGGREENSGGM